jgi:hypothetical protein
MRLSTLGDDYGDLDRIVSKRRITTRLKPTDESLSGGRVRMFTAG